VDGEKSRIQLFQTEWSFVSAVFDTIAALVVVLDRDGCIVYFNRAFGETTGYALEEVQAKSFADIFLTAEGRDRLNASFLNAHPGQVLKIYESSLVAKDGSQRLFEWSDIILFDAEDETEYVVVTGIDIEEAHRQERKASILSEIIRHISSTLRIDEVLELVLEYAGAFFGADRGVIALYDERRDGLRYAASQGFTADVIAAMQTTEDDFADDFLGQTLRVCPLIIEDAALAPQVPAQFAELLDFQSALAVPLEAGERVLGVMALLTSRDRSRHFSHDDAALALTMSKQVAIAIDNAQRYKTQQRRTEQFRVISEVGRYITSILDVDELLEEIVRLVKEVLGYYLVMVGLVEGNELVFSHGMGGGWDAAGLQSLRLSIDGPEVAAQAARTGELILVSEAHQDPAPRRHALIDDAQSVLSAPMKTKDKVVGVLHILCNRLDAFDESDLAVLQSLAYQAAIAIENAQFYEKAQQVAVLHERQRLARELHDSVTQSLYSATLLAETGRQAMGAEDWAVVEDCVNRMGEVAQQALKEMRLLVYELRPSVLEHVGLEGALQQRLHAVEARAGVDAHLIIECEIDLDPHQEIVLYRIAQEALNNTLKHAAATQVTVRVQCDDAVLKLEIADNGCGFDPQAASEMGGMGLVTMRERVENLGARLEIESKFEAGTKITVTLDVGKPGDVRAGT
jgi:PAS domain S-box-containing protein